MTSWRDAKIRFEETWAQVLRGWEAGETAASLALRFDVGLANLWRRRAAEGWERNRPDDPAPEPVEGWDLWAQRRVEAWETEIEAQRELARDLARAMAGGPLEEAPLWHLSFLYAFRAEHLGPEVAAQDRARAVEKDQPWVSQIWDDDGRLRSMHRLDQAMLRLNRDVWRKSVGLPDGAAPHWP